MPGNHPTPRPPAESATRAATRPRPIRSAAGGLAILVALAVILIIPNIAAAETLYDEDLTEYLDTSHRGIAQQNPSQGPTSSPPKILVFKDITAHKTLHYVVMEFAGNFEPSMDEGRYDFNYVFNGQTRPGVVYKTVGRNLLGTITVTRLQVFFNEWDIGELTGKQTITLPFITSPVINRAFQSNTGSAYLSYSASQDIGPTGDYNVLSSLYWTNHITVTDDNIARGYYTELHRSVDGLSNPSTINFTKTNTVIFSNADDVTGFLGWFTYDEIDCITVTNPNGRQYVYPLDAGSGPTTQAAVTVYIQNSQTGALLANAHLTISAAVADPIEYHEVINETLPGGTKTYTLQPTGPVNPNPRYYRLTADVPGYNNVMPYIDFELTSGVPLFLHVMMEPTGSPPVNENNTFIEVYVRDTHANPISGASVTLDRYTLQTNSAGYTQFELPKNAAYAYTVRKTGYMTVQGTAQVEDGPRYTINVALGQGSVPTYTPTPGPGETPGATPTPDHRTNEQKGQAVIDMIADNAEGIGALALICLLMGLLKLLTKW